MTEPSWTRVITEDGLDVFTCLWDVFIWGYLWGYKWTYKERCWLELRQWAIEKHPRTWGYQIRLPAFMSPQVDFEWEGKRKGKAIKGGPFHGYTEIKLMLPPDVSYSTYISWCQRAKDPKASIVTNVQDGQICKLALISGELWAGWTATKEAGKVIAPLAKPQQPLPPEMQA